MNQSLSTSSGELHELTDLHCFQPWFFLQWAAVDGEKHNWLEWWGKETVSVLNGMSVLTLLPPRLGGYHGRRQKDVKRMRRNPGNCNHLDTMWPLRSRTHNSCLLPAPDLRPSQPGSQHRWRRWSSGPTPIEALLATESSGEGPSFFVEDVTTGRFSMLYWLHTHECMVSTNWT